MNSGAVNTLPVSLRQLYNAGQEISGGLFLEWAPIPNDQEENLADTQRANWAVKQLQKITPTLLFGVGFMPRITELLSAKIF